MLLAQCSLHAGMTVIIIITFFIIIIFVLFQWQSQI